MYSKLNKSRQFKLFVFRAVLAPLFFIAKNFYVLFLGWWLEPYWHRRETRYFRNSIREAMPFLFVERMAKIIPNPPHKPRRRWDFELPAIVTISTKRLLFSFAQMRWREEMSIRATVAPSHDPRDSYELSCAIWAAGAQNSLEPDNWSSIREVAALLGPHISVLEKAFSEESFPKTRERLVYLAIHGKKAAQFANLP